MDHVHLISDTNSLLLRGLIYPARDDLDLGLAAGLSQAGDVHVGKKQPPVLTLARSFAGVRDIDFEALKDWYLYVAEGPCNTFTFVDGDGLSYTVRWMNGPADWQKDAANRWSGKLMLRVEGFAP